jgi:hypothetical protein
MVIIGCSDKKYGWDRAKAAKHAPKKLEAMFTCRADGRSQGQDMYDQRRHPHHIVHLYLVVLVVVMGWNGLCFGLCLSTESSHL